MKLILVFFPLLASQVFSLSILQGPQVGNLSDSGVTVSWTTDSLSDSRVETGTSPSSFTSVVTDTARTFRHIVLAGKLLPGTRYFYRVKSDGVTSRAFHLNTFPAKGGDIRFGSFGDTHGGGDLDNLNYLWSNKVLEDSCHLLFNIGDVVGNNDVPESTCYRLMMNYLILSDSIEHSIPIYEAFGNHDAWEGMRKIWAGTDTNLYGFVLPETPGIPAGYPKGSFYSFDAGSVHFAVLSPYFKTGTGSPLSTEALAWLASDLQKARMNGMQHIVAMAHDAPLAPMNTPAGMASAWISGTHPNRGDFYNVMDTLGVELFLFGHNHNYSRMRIGPGANPAIAAVWASKGRIVQIETGVIGGSRYTNDTAWRFDVYRVEPRNNNCYTVFDTDFRQMTGRFKVMPSGGTVFYGDSFTLRPDAPTGLSLSESGGRATLRWNKTPDRISLHGVGGYHVYRSATRYGDLRNTSTSAYVRIGSLPSPDSTLFTDASPLPGGNSYVVSAFDTNAWHREGNYSNEVTDATLIETGIASGDLTVDARPNPFQSSVALCASTACEARLFDPAGRLVRSFSLSPKRAVKWDGRDSRNRPAPKGIYLLRTASAGRHSSVRLLVLN